MPFVIRSLCSLALFGSTTAAQHVFDVVAVQGQPAPGIDGATHNGLRLMGVGPNGHVLFDSRLLGVPADDEWAMWVWDENSHRLVAREGDPAVGVPDNAVHHEFWNGHVDGDGRVLWAGRVRYTTPAGHAMWRETEGGQALIVRDLGPLPDAPNGTVSSAAGIMDIGGGPFAGIHIRESASGGTRPVFYGLEGATPSLLARHGAPAPLFGPGAVWVLSSGTPVRTDAGGNALFRAMIQNPAGTALVYGPAGGLQLLARSGDPVPGAPGATYTGFQEGYDLSDDGAAVFVATGTGVVRAVLAGTPGNVELLAKNGDPAPGLPGYVMSEVGMSNLPPQVMAGANGALCFAALVRPAGGGAFQPALYRRMSGGGLELTLYTGQSIPGTGHTIVNIRPNAWFIDGRGAVAAECTLSGNARAIVTWAYADGPRILVKTGDSVQVAPGDVRAVTGVNLASSLDEPLMPQGTLSNDGRIAFRLSLALNGGTTPGIFSTTIPRGCDPIDFNRDGLYPDNQDLLDYLAVFGGGACPTGSCGDLDYNNDGLFPDNADIEALFRVFGGGGC